MSKLAKPRQQGVANLSLITYNLRRNKAHDEVKGLAGDHNPDVICLQECTAEELAESVGTMTLAGRTDIGRHGLAVFVRSNRFTVVSSKSYVLPKSLWELATREVRQRLLVVQLRDRQTGRDMLIGSFHATHPVASNLHRRRQVYNTIRQLDTYPPAPAIVVGDYNYPFLPGQLRRYMQRLGFTLMVPSKHTFRDIYFRGYFDFAASRDLDCAHVEVLEQKASDHLPVLFKFF